jgi:hypothetical protein
MRLKISIMNLTMLIIFGLNHSETNFHNHPEIFFS